jgi:hypothetical protein
MYGVTFQRIFCPCQVLHDVWRNVQRIFCPCQVLHDVWRNVQRIFCPCQFLHDVWRNVPADILPLSILWYWMWYWRQQTEEWAEMRVISFSTWIIITVSNTNYVVSDVTKIWNESAVTLDFALRDWGNPWNKSVMTASVQARITIEHLPNTSMEHYFYTNLFGKNTRIRWSATSNITFRIHVSDSS